MSTNERRQPCGFLQCFCLLWVLVTVSHNLCDCDTNLMSPDSKLPEQVQIREIIFQHSAKTVPHRYNIWMMSNLGLEEKPAEILDTRRKVRAIAFCRSVM